MESVIATREEVERFLSIQNYNFGYDYGNGSGGSSGTGYGYGSCSGYGFGLGGGGSCGYYDGTGYGYGDSHGYGDSDGYGYGHGHGRGAGNSDGTGYGYTNGIGRYYEEGNIQTFNGATVDYIDNVPTIITQVHGNIACGYIIREDLTLHSCFIAKVGNSFSHGKTIKDAVADAEAKEMENMPVEERVKKFMEVFGPLGSEHTGKKFYDWHHFLTGSCRMGRDEFCEAHDIDLEKKYTVRYFLDITKGSYGGDIIKLIREAYETI